MNYALPYAKLRINSWYPLDTEGTHFQHRLHESLVALTRRSVSDLRVTVLLNDAEAMLDLAMRYISHTVHVSAVDRPTKIYLADTVQV